MQKQLSLETMSFFFFFLFFLKSASEQHAFNNSLDSCVIINQGNIIARQMLQLLSTSLLTLSTIQGVVDQST